jgi:hypothetical protein
MDDFLCGICAGEGPEASGFTTGQPRRAKDGHKRHPAWANSPPAVPGDPQLGDLAAVGGRRGYLPPNCVVRYCSLSCLVAAWCGCLLIDGLNLPSRSIAGGKSALNAVILPHPDWPGRRMSAPW